MSYRSLLIQIATGRDNSNTYAVSAALSEMFDASVIGVAAARLTPPFTEVPIVDLIRFEQEAAENTLKQAEAEFRASFRGKDIQLSWRMLCDYAPVTDFVAREARAADLVIASAETGKLLGRQAEAHLGPLVLQAGRPVLIVPKDQKGLSLRKVVVAWKDAREARRAASDALPLLKKAAEVVVVEICDPAEAEAAANRVADVTHWLRGHGITARAAAERCEGSELGGLYRFLQRESCDLVVAGAYGHTRLREWIFGGVTVDLLLTTERCVLLSH